LADDQVLAEQGLHQAVVPAARVVLLVVLQDVPDVVGVEKEMGRQRAHVEADHVAEALSGPQQIAERVGQELPELAIGEWEPLRAAWGGCHASALRRRAPRAGTPPAPAVPG